MIFQRLIITALGVALISPACGVLQSESNVLDVSASEYDFRLTGNLVTGLTTIRFRNDGQELHHAIIDRLDEGVTKQDALGVLTSPTTTTDEAWLHDGPIDLGVVDSGLSQTVQVRFEEPGTYLFLCVVPSRGDRAPHAFEGMIETIDVSAGPNDDEPRPADSSIILSDLGIEVSGFMAGQVTFAAINDGLLQHDISIVKPAPGRTADDVTAWLAAGLPGVPPIMTFAGSQAFGTGESVIITVDLPPGTYDFLCLVPTEAGRIHAALGMRTEVTIS